MQLNLFTTPTQQLQQYPWQYFFDWVPMVGGYAQIHAVTIDGMGYTYGMRVRILQINGNNITAEVAYKHGSNLAHENGKQFSCHMHDLWPPIYG